ncbi:MAG: sulfatase-like hydrolase/transferase, partial [Lentisphaerae bacterium]|nr:sulfatase-like hydrolase/transferase [Lentisphaerota bacterium]
YPHNTGVWSNGNYTLPESSRTWMQAIRAAGYRTSLFGKTHLHPHGGDLREREHLMHAYGIDDVDEIGGPRASARLRSHMTARWEAQGLWKAYQDDYAERFTNKPHVVRPSVLPLEEYADTYVGQRAKAYLTEYSRSEPWCCWVSFGGPHEPWDTPEPYASMYAPANMPPPAPCPEWCSDLADSELKKRLQRAPVLHPEDVAAMRANYAGNVTLIDDQIGEILGVIEKRGELENTVIAFTSDHGELNGDYGLIYKSVSLNGCVRVPLLIRTPNTLGTSTGGVCEGPVEWADVGPTLAELAGNPLDYEQFAVSLVPALTDPHSRPRKDAISEIAGEVMLLTDEWRIVLNAEGQPYLLFDVRSDPLEQANLAGRSEYADVQSRLVARVLERLVQSQTHLT